MSYITPFNRIEFSLLFDVTDANLNGDPDLGNAARTDPETGHGLMTSGCFNRKVRNYVSMVKAGVPGYEIFVRENHPLNIQMAEIVQAAGLPLYDMTEEKAADDTDDEEEAPVEEPKGKKGKKGAKKVGAAKDRPQEEIQKLQNIITAKFFDVRAFGGVLSTGPNCGQIRGPIQMSMSRSIDPVLPLDMGITRCVGVNPPGSDAVEGRMGRKHAIPYGLFRANGFINPLLAAQTGFSAEDLKLFFEALGRMFTFDASSARGPGAILPRELYVFEHATAYGDCPMNATLGKLEITRKPDVVVPRKFTDYNIHCNVTAPGVSVNVTRY